MNWKAYFFSVVVLVSFFTMCAGTKSDLFALDVGIAIAGINEGPYENPSVDVLQKIASKDVAYQTILSVGITPSEILYFDTAPYDVNGKGDFELAWVAVVKKGDTLLGTFVNILSGEVMAREVPLHEGLRSHLISIGAMDSIVINSVGQYESYPWGYDLPTNFGNHALTCGYGCGYHTGNNHYAVDLGMSYGECIPAPGSGWVMMAGDRGDGYGKQVIIKAGPTGLGNNYVYRVAHLSETYVIPGWWADKNRTLGAAGCTGNCTGTHLHFSIHRGSYSSGQIIGESVPLDRWPGPNDRVDYFDRYQYWQFSFNVCR